MSFLQLAYLGSSLTTMPQKLWIFTIIAVNGKNPAYLFPSSIIFTTYLKLLFCPRVVTILQLAYWGS